MPSLGIGIMSAFNTSLFYYSHGFSMRSRLIANYLSSDEVGLISDFLERSMGRFEKYNGLVRMAPQRFNTDELQRLYVRKYNLWDTAVKTQVPESSSRYLDIIRGNDEAAPCPIERFLKTFMQIIEQSIPPNKLEDLLARLESDVAKCEYQCPCPAEGV